MGKKSFLTIAIFLVFFSGAIYSCNYALIICPFLFSFFGIVASGYYRKYNTLTRLFFNVLGVSVVAVTFIDITVSSYLTAKTHTDFFLLLLMPFVVSGSFFFSKNHFKKST